MVKSRENDIARPTSVPSSRALRTRTALLDAGLHLLAERPVDAIAVDELVGAAGVAKGSFFNHFADKHAFAAAIAEDIRAELEARVERFNAGEEAALVRLSGGMIVAAAFALGEPRRTTIMARNASSQTMQDHPLNRGVIADLRASWKQGLIAPANEASGVLFWLGCCHTVMSALVTMPDDGPASLRVSVSLRVLADMMRQALRGLGAAPEAIASLTAPATLAARLDRALSTADYVVSS